MTSPFSFHCMICFEEFQGETRFPVVLPCGHTYICNECAGRLDKCMECRTPLIEFVPSDKAGHNQCVPTGTSNSGVPGWSTRSLGSNNARGVGNRGSVGNRGNVGTKNKPAQPPIKRRLPLPKNVVLMSLIEATELATENVQGQEHKLSLHDSPMVNPSVLDMDEDEEEKIRTGTSLAISDCGTYAVAAKDGLEILLNRPESLLQHSEEDVDTLVRFYNKDSTIGVQIDGDDKKTVGEEPRKESSPGRLSWGDRVQIVSTQNGWAKMARGYGYIRAGAQQLVKVGGSVDRSCKLEAMLRLMSSRRKELREEQKKIDNQFIAYMNELQVSLMSDEDLTVIAADTFHKNIENNDPSATSSTVTDPAPPARDAAAAAASDIVRPSNSYEDSTPLKPRFMERPMTPPGDNSRGSFFCSSSDVLNAVLPLSSSRTQPPALPSVTRSPAIAREFNNMNQQQKDQFQNYPQTPRHDRHSHYHHHHHGPIVEDTPTRILTSASHPSPSALRAGARAWREMHGRPASDGIDFRTGMSGHSALFSSSAHPHDYLVQTQRFFTGMSNHTGLTMWKAPKFPFSLTTSTTDGDSISDPPTFPSPGTGGR
mmetsp:Transcript_59565/g.66648  ORF Transcript_59565/g.66648 Transcript_59565/m.66648 type:complete len:596 (-) Transcript_59565:1263-3050(-)|eukprot:CAMPEP_0170778424 /NCGR_PEP_ID=MMETSP0733-20121128/12386_1 /TAXON_ID=186038 /ORGANISM="Fragilariopsis kerguelensis, Strain L26-C5" /LENGTH=595 /DNA_ID=CAMNT_0011121851 /DNA_START=405 /DNA_END=2192 /DNA_ORIENTATION=+